MATDSRGSAVGDVVTVEQAAGVLGVKPATIYAYISRGLLSSRRMPEDRRSWLSRAEVERFSRRRGARPLAVPVAGGGVDVRDGVAASADGAGGAGSARQASAESPGAPGEIVHDRLLYWGHEATELAVCTPYPRVAELLWTGRLGPGRFRRPDARLRGRIATWRAAMPESSLPLDRMKSTAMLLGAADPFRYDLSRPAALACARTLIPAFVEALPARQLSRPGGDLAVPARGVPADHPGGDPADHAGGDRDADAAAESATSGRGSAELPLPENWLVDRLWARLTGGGERPGSARRALLSAALVLLADHGLGPSTRAAREAAASAADPYSVVLAGMSVASGLLLGGGSSLAVQAWLEEIDSVASVPRVLADRLLRGDRVSGFGQPRYRGPDPRAAVLLRLLAESGGDQERQRIVRAVVATVRERRHLAPNVEFALGAMCYVHGMPRGAGEAIFVIARSAGWIAHAVQIYERVPGVLGDPLTRG